MIRISKLRSRLHRWPAFLPVMVLAFLLAPQSRALLHADDGDLDPSFGIGGRVTTDFSNQFDMARAVAVQADGKIVVAGNTSGIGPTSDFALARYLADGALDTTFGAGGRVTTDFNAGFDIARAIAIQADGKIVVAGETSTLTDQDFALARYNTDGSLDATFGAGGLVVTDFGTPFAGAVAVAVQSNGMIVAAGSTFDEMFQSDFAVARYDADGSLDASFDGDGRVTTEVSTFSNLASGLALQADGRIVVAGTVFPSDFGLVRYNTDGSLDTSFGGDGTITTDFGLSDDRGDAIAIQTDGKIVVVGMSAKVVNVTRFALARYNADGSLDAAFGSGGMVTTDFTEGLLDRAAGVALQADGKIVAAGKLVSSKTLTDFAVARYETDGSLDTTFGADGTITTDIIAGSADEAQGVAIQADGRIVAVGITSAGPASGGGDFAVVRYDVSPPPHELTFFLHGFDVPGTAGSFTMNLTPPAPHVLVSQTSSVSWSSDPVIDGTFVAGATFQITLPCTGGVAQSMRVHLSSTDADGGVERQLGVALVAKHLCQSQTITVPVTTPTTLAQRRLKLTFLSALPVVPPLELGPRTFMRATRFVGTP